MEAPVFLQRQVWGGRHQGRGLMTLPVGIIHVHHSVTNETTGVRPTDDAIADFLRLDAEGLYGGIAYSYAIHPEGVIGEGQGLSIGTHTANWNGFPWDLGTSFGICFVGDFQPREGVVADELTPEAVNAFRFLRDVLLAQGALAPGYELRGHRDAPTNSTACPGDNIEGHLDLLRPPYETPPPAAPTPEDPMSNTIKWRGTLLSFNVNEAGDVTQTDADLTGTVKRDRVNVVIAHGAKPFAPVEAALAEGTDDILLRAQDPHGGAFHLRYSGQWLDAFGKPLPKP